MYNFSNFNFSNFNFSQFPNLKDENISNTAKFLKILQVENFEKSHFGRCEGAVRSFDNIFNLALVVFPSAVFRCLYRDDVAERFEFVIVQDGLCEYSGGLFDLQRVRENWREKLRLTLDREA